jgi:hypothetical protein
MNCNLTALFPVGEAFRVSGGCRALGCGYVKLGLCAFSSFVFLVRVRVRVCGSVFDSYACGLMSRINALFKY